MAESKLNKLLHTDITRLKLCSKPDAPVRFLVEKTPFDDDDEETSAAATPKDYVIIGRIFPKSDIFKEGAYQIEMKLTSTFPATPPEVRFLTPIYHPNVKKDGQFCHELLLLVAQWKPNKSLVDVVTVIVERIDNPDADYAFSPELGKEYVDNRPEFNRKALEYVKAHALPRN